MSPGRRGNLTHSGGVHAGLREGGRERGREGGRLGKREGGSKEEEGRKGEGKGVARTRFLWTTFHHFLQALPHDMDVLNIVGLVDHVGVVSSTLIALPSSSVSHCIDLGRGRDGGSRGEDTVAKWW